MPSTTWGVVMACGKEGKLPPEVDVAFLNLGSSPILSYSLAAFEHCPDIDRVAVVVPKDRLEGVRVMAQMFGFMKLRKIIAGGAQRLPSLTNALKELDDDAGVVCVHDAWRPGVTPGAISAVVKVARKQGGAASAVRIADPVKIVERGAKISEGPDPEKLWATQTPQAFKVEVLTKACEKAVKRKLAPVDDTDAVMLAGGEVHIVPLERPIRRIMALADLTLGDQLLR